MGNRCKDCACAEFKKYEKSNADKRYKYRCYEKDIDVSGYAIACKDFVEKDEEDKELFNY